MRPENREKPMSQWIGALMIISTAAALPLVSLAGKVGDDTAPRPVIEQAAGPAEATVLAITTTD